MYVFIDNGGIARYGIVNGEQITAIEGDLFGEYQVTGKNFELAGVKLLAPCVPSKVIAIGTNYMDHTLQTNSPVVKAPLMFIKATTAVIGPYDDIVSRKTVSALTSSARWAS